MKILQIMAGKGNGGAETYAVDIMLSLHREGIDQIVVMHPKAPRLAELVAAGVRVETDVLRYPFRFLQRYRLRRLVARERPGLIHCWMRRAASLTPRGLSVPVIGWFGGYYHPKNFKACSHFVGVTQDIVAHMAKKGVDPARAIYVPTFPDVRAEAPVDKRKVDTPPGAKVVLALSRLHPKKGIDTLLRAAKGLPDVHVWIAGDGPLEDDLKALAVRLGVSDRAHFLGWRTDRAALLRAADVCALPSRYEPFGTVILEAWAAGTPFVACKSAGPAAHVEDGRTGLLVDIDDVDGLRTALSRALTDQELRRKLVAEGFSAYLAGYTREAVTAKMLGVYRQLIGEVGL